MDLQRQIVPLISKYLSREEILLIIGPRQVGKTVILHQLENSLKLQGNLCYFLNLEDPDYLTLLNKSPKNLFQIFPIDLNKPNFLLIDEVQYLKKPSNFLKYFFDEYKGKIKIIASGSSAFYLDKKFEDSLSGRKKIFTLYTLSFREFLSFKNEPSLSVANFEKLTLSEKEKISLFYLEYLTYGGYPKVVLSPIEEKIEILRDLAYSYIKKDIFEAHIRQDEYFYKLMKILSAQIGNLVNSFELSRTLNISKTSVDNYLYVMQKSFHVGLIRPYYKNIRKELTKMPKVYFIDLGLRNFFKNDFRPLVDRDDKGQLLENAVFRQILDSRDLSTIKFWRTTDDKEVDFIIEDQDMAYEVKSRPGGIKLQRYHAFNDEYPNIKLKFVSLEDVWKI